MKVINRTFKKIGWVLLVLGIIDLAILIFCLFTERYYSSNFNVFAIVPGLFLLRGSVKTARILRWFSPFAVLIASGFFTITTISKPLDLILAQVMLNTFVTLVDFGALLIFVGVLIWVYRQLNSEESVLALSKAGYKTGRPLSAIIASLVIVIIAGVGSYIVLTGETAEKAKRLAAERVGNNYRFYVNSVEFAGEHGAAVVTVYNNTMITELPVEW